MEKNLAFLLRPENYHPLTQLDIPPAFRSEFPDATQHEPLASSLAALDDLLKEGHFLPAAHFSASILTSPVLSPTDDASIFHLLYIRLSCLELTGNTILAAQEAKSLEDLSSTFYYVDGDLGTAGPSHPLSRGQNIVPWPLRVLAVRLQSIAFGDARRGVAGFYELGVEARRQLQRPEISHQEQAEWRERLADLGIRVVNALIEMGDVDTARRSLADMKPPAGGCKHETGRMALLNLRIGDVEAAQKLLEGVPHSDRNILRPLMSMADGRYSDAATEWEALSEERSDSGDKAMIVQNHAVCLLYLGKLSEVCLRHSYPEPSLTGDFAKSRQMMETLIEEGNSFQSLTFNLATIYELCSENSDALKLDLTQRVSKLPPSRNSNWERPNVDFKM